VAAPLYYASRGHSGSNCGLPLTPESRGSVPDMAPSLDSLHPLAASATHTLVSTCSLVRYGRVATGSGTGVHQQ
jgi:hypothetical protein